MAENVLVDGETGEVLSTETVPELPDPPPTLEDQLAEVQAALNALAGGE